MWRAYPVGWFCRRYRVEDGGRTLATLEFGSWSERGALELDGRRLAIRREGFWNPRFFLSEGTKDLVTSLSAGAFRRGFYLAHGDDEYRLDPSSFFGRSYALTQRGRPVGEVRAVGFFSRHYQVELDGELAPELRLFALWLVLLAHRRAAAAAAGAAAG